MSSAPEPGCVKLDCGSGGRGFTSYKTREELLALLRRDVRPRVVQPLVKGDEYRVTVCADGTFAVAKLLGRRGPRASYVDAMLPRQVLSRLLTVVERLAVAGAGFDVIRSGSHFWVLDVNLSPAFAIHARDLASAYLESWLQLQASPALNRS